MLTLDKTEATLRDGLHLSLAVTVNFGGPQFRPGYHAHMKVWYGSGGCVLLLKWYPAVYCPKFSRYAIFQII